MNPAHPVRIALADDHSLFRNGIRSTILSFGGYQVIIEAENGQQLLEGLRRLETRQAALPDICITDLSMPGYNGYEVIREIREKWSGMPVLVLSFFANRHSLLRSLYLGASGFLSKGCSQEQLKEALTAIRETGGFYTDLPVGDSRFPRGDEALPHITSREMEFLSHCCTDLSYKDVAGRMNISIRTVESYRDSLYEKLGIRNRTGLIIFAVKTGMIMVDEVLGNRPVP